LSRRFQAASEYSFRIKLAFNPGKEAGGYRNVIFHKDLRKIAARQVEKAAGRLVKSGVGLS